MSGVARAGAPVALIGAAVANLASVPIFVHAYAIASPLSVALLRLLGCAVVLVAAAARDAPARGDARRALVASGSSGRSGSSA